MNITKKLKTIPRLVDVQDALQSGNKSNLQKTISSKIYFLFKSLFFIIIPQFPFILSQSIKNGKIYLTKRQQVCYHRLNRNEGIVFMRLFIAICFNDSVKDALKKTTDRLADMSYYGNFTRKEN